LKSPRECSTIPYPKRFEPFSGRTGPGRFRCGRPDHLEENAAMDTDVKQYINDQKAKLNQIKEYL
jgi:hypothetical protein